MNYTNKLQKKNFEPDMMYSLKKRSTNNNRKRQQFRKRSVSPGESNRNRSPLKSPNYVSQIWTYIIFCHLKYSNPSGHIRLLGGTGNARANRKYGGSEKNRGVGRSDNRDGGE